MKAVSKERLGGLAARVGKIGREIADQLPGSGNGDCSRESLLDIHEIAEAELSKRFPLSPVALKHPMPERPPRALGLVHVDGRVFCSEKISRLVFLKIRLPRFVAIRSMFIRPRMELDLPVFAAEVVRIGRKRMLIVDIHRTGADTGHDDSALFDRMIAVRDRYPSLNDRAITQKGEIQSVFSRAACQAWITAGLDDDALALFREYLAIFAELLARTEPLEGADLDRTKAAYEKYLGMLVDHDPGVLGFRRLFGDPGGVERAMNIHFDR